MSFRTPLISLIFLLLISTGCHRMMTIKTNHPEADIYVNGDHVGQGTVTLKRMGLPETAVIKVEHGDQVETRTISRTMTLSTVGLAVISAYTGFLWAWEYPETLDVNLPSRSVEKMGPYDGESWTTASAVSSFQSRIGKKRQPKVQLSEPKSQTSEQAEPSRKDGSGNPWTRPL